MNSLSNFAPTRALPMSTTGGLPVMTYFSCACAWTAPAILALTRTILSAAIDDAALLDLRGGVRDVEADHVGADREAGEVVVALVVGQRRVLALRTLQDDRDATERHAGVLVGHATGDPAGGLLSAGDSPGREQQRHPQGGCCTTNAVHLASLSLRR